MGIGVELVGELGLGDRLVDGSLQLSEASEGEAGIDHAESEEAVASIEVIDRNGGTRGG